MRLEDGDIGERRLRWMHQLHHALGLIWRDGDGDEWVLLASDGYVYAADRNCRNIEAFVAEASTCTAREIRDMYRSLRPSRKQIFFMIEERP